MAQNHSKRWQKALQVERDQRMRLEETLEQLAKQHNHLERAFRGATVLPSSLNNPALGSKGRASVRHHNICYWPLLLPAPDRTVSSFCAGSVSGKGDASDEDDDNEFFDAMEDPAEFITVPADPKYHRLTSVWSTDFVLYLLLVLISVLSR